MKRLFLIVLSFFFLTTPALAWDSKADRWIVSQRSGDARVVRHGIQPASLAVNAALAPGDVVITGASGRATLARGADYIVIAPHSELRLPSASQPRGFTRVIQQIGTMLFKVRHTGVPHFAVDTPMLAAVVKGTTFTVIVDRDRSAVQVIEGAVEVIATEGGMKRLVEGGNTVFIDRGNPRQLITADAKSLGASGSPSATTVKVAGSQGESVAAVAALTGGLVKAEPVQLAANTTPAIVGALVAPVAPVNDGGTAVQPDPAAGEAPADTVKPITEPVTKPVAEVLPDVDPIAEPDVKPIVEPILEPIVDPILEPIVDPILEPIVEPILEPILEPIVEPIVEIVAPVVDPIVELVEPVVDPIVELVEPVVDPIVELVEPVVEPIVEVVAPVVEPIVEIVAPVVEPIVEVVEPVVEPIVEIVEPVVEPIVEVVAPVVEPIVEVVAPITEILPPLLPGL